MSELADPFAEEVGYIELMHVRDHAAVKPPGYKGKKNRWRCQVCGRGPFTLPHLGSPRSMNVLGSGSAGAFYGAKDMWTLRFVELLRKARVPKPLGSVRAEGLICFPDRIDRDQGNFRFMVEKALGDALQVRDSDDVPWLAKDNWSRYEFGNLRRHYEKGISYMLIRVWPSDEPLPDVAFDFMPPKVEDGVLALTRDP